MTRGTLYFDYDISKDLIEVASSRIDFGRGLPISGGLIDLDRLREAKRRERHRHRPDRSTKGCQRAVRR